jgi:hypothetical protein
LARGPGFTQVSLLVSRTGLPFRAVLQEPSVPSFENHGVCRNRLPLPWPVSVPPCQLPSCLVFATSLCSLRACHSSWSVHESSVAVHKAAYLDNRLLCRIVVHSCRMQLLTAQFSPIVNTEPEDHTTDVPKRELPGTIGDSPSEPAKNMSGTLGIRTLSYRALSLRAYDCSPPRYNLFERSLGGLLKLASQDSNRSLGRFCSYALQDGRRCPIPSKFQAQPGASFGATYIESLQRK